MMNLIDYFSSNPSEYIRFKKTYNLCNCNEFIFKVNIRSHVFLKTYAKYLIQAIDNRPS